MDSIRPVGDGSAMVGILGRTGLPRTFAYFFIAGASLALAAFAISHGGRANATALLAIVGVAYGAGFLLLTLPRALSPSAVPALLALAAVLVTAAVYADGTPASPYALLYVWMGAGGAYLLDRLKTWLLIALAGGAYAGVVAALGGGLTQYGRWLLVVGAVGAAALLVGRLRDRIKRVVEELTVASRNDVLTGLLNRRAFEELFDVELARACRNDRPLSVVVCGLDAFEEAAEASGDKGADELVARFATEIGKWKRRGDVAARIGDSEFGVLLPETDERAAFLVAERIRRSAHRLLGDDQPGLTASLGIAAHPEHGDDPVVLVRTADQALAAAREMGPDRTVIYSEEVARIVATAEAPGERGELQLATVVRLAEALDLRDSGSPTHAQTVGDYARMTAEELGLEPERAERVRLAGLLHDVGRIAISDDVLTKPGPLNEEEWREVHAHPDMAARLLARPELTDLRDWIAAHHERPDGTGYPKGITAEGIPLESRILAVADAYEAMTNDRAYRPALPVDEARKELLEGAGSQFDGDVVEAFLRALKRPGEGAQTVPEPTVTK